MKLFKIFISMLILMNTKFVFAQNTHKSNLYPTKGILVEIEECLTLSNKYPSTDLANT